MLHAHTLTDPVRWKADKVTVLGKVAGNVAGIRFPSLSLPLVLLPT